MIFSALFSKDKKPEYYFGIFLQSNKAVGFVYEVLGTSISIVAKDTVSYTNGWEDVIEDIDRLLSSLEEETKLQVVKTIFFLYATFVDEEAHQIRTPYKKTIKTIAKELDLEPLGYIDCYEAVKEFIEEQSHGPFNGCLIEVDAKHVSVFVYKGGKNVFHRESARTHHLGDDIASLFSHKDESILLPSRTVIYGQTPSEDLRKQVSDYTWDESQFVQPPRIEWFETNELSESLRDTFLRQILHDDTDKKQETQKLDQHKEEQKLSPQLKEQPPEETSPQLLGFVIGEDIRTADVQKPATEIDTDKKHDTTKKTQSQEPKNAEIASALGFQISEHDEKPDDNASPPPTKKGNLPKITLPAMPSLPKIDLTYFLPRRFPVKTVVSVLFILIFLGGIFAAVEYFFHTVTVTVSFPKEIVTEEFSLSYTIGEETEGVTITENTFTQELSESKSSTGTKEVGEQATGTVLLHNFAEDPVSLSAGTTVAADGRAFTLNDAVSIPASQESEDSTGVVKQPGKVEASTTATEIGTEYNIADGTRMSIGDLSSATYFALAEGDFTGGSKENVTVVSETDHANLEEQINEQIQGIDVTERLEDVPEGHTVIEDLTETTVEALDFSSPVGTEADSVDVSATVIITIYSYDETAFKDMLLTQVKPQIPEGYAAGTNTLTYDVTSAAFETSDDEDALTEEEAERILSMKGVVDAGAIKNVDKEEITQAIAGTFIDEADTILRERYDVADYTITTESELLMIHKQWLPLMEQNITLDVQNQSEETQEDETES